MEMHDRQSRMSTLFSRALRPEILQASFVHLRNRLFKLCDAWQTAAKAQAVFSKALDLKSFNRPVAISAIASKSTGDAWLAVASPRCVCKGVRIKILQLSSGQLCNRIHTSCGAWPTVARTPTVFARASDLELFKQPFASSAITTKELAMQG